VNLTSRKRGVTILAQAMSPVSLVERQQPQSGNPGLLFLLMIAIEGQQDSIPLATDGRRFLVASGCAVRRD
jgi:hypothetical protein